jgi:hypothetical protein
MWQHLSCVFVYSLVVACFSRLTLANEKQEIVKGHTISADVIFCYSVEKVL